MKRQSPMSAIEPMIRREREMYHELKHQNVELLEALKELFAAHEAISKENDLSKLAEPMFRLTKAVVSAKQLIAKAEGKE